MQISVFNENINLENQMADDNMNYSSDHSDLAQRVMAIKLIISGNAQDLSPQGGVPVSVKTHHAKGGTVIYQWMKSPDQSNNDPQGYIKGQIYEVVRKIKGQKALVGWEDKWWQRVALLRANDNTNFAKTYRTFETIRNTEVAAGEEHRVWLFLSDIDKEFIYMPTWLDRAFNGKDLWVRVLNGTLKGGLFKVKKNEDFLGIGFNNNGALALPASFPDKKNIRLYVHKNDSPKFAGKFPNAKETSITKRPNYITLGGIKYLFNSAFYGAVDPVRSNAHTTNYTDEDENDSDKGSGHFLSVNLNSNPKEYLTDTIAPLIRFY